MKKIIYFVGSLILLCLMFVLPASAARYTNQPVTIPLNGGWTNGDYYGEEVYFSDQAYLTINDVEIYAYLNGDVKDLSIYMDGVISHAYTNYFFKIHCYDAQGAYLSTAEEYLYFSEQYFTDHYVGWISVPATTAMVEFEAGYPGSWVNTYFYSRFINVAADDGRVVGIYDLLEPNYEAVGWHGRVWVYALDGRELRVAYTEVPAYKAVGWYDQEEYSMIKFRELCQTCFAVYDYKSVVDEARYLLNYVLKRADYISEVQSTLASAMVTWQAVTGGSPLIMTNSEISYDYEDGKYKVRNTFYNVAFKPIVAFKTEFTCHNIFGEVVRGTHTYYIDSTYLESGVWAVYYWSLPVEVDHIENFRVTQIVFEDRTTWTPGA